MVAASSAVENPTGASTWKSVNTVCSSTRTSPAVSTRMIIGPPSR